MDFMRRRFTRIRARFATKVDHGPTTTDWAAAGTISNNNSNVNYIYGGANIYNNNLVTNFIYIPDVPDESVCNGRAHSRVRWMIVFSGGKASQNLSRLVIGWQKYYRIV